MTAPVTGPFDEDKARWLPQTIGGSVYILVVGMVLAGLGITAAGAWRTGLAWMGSGLLVGAVTRALLSERGAGMLRIRRRWSDVVTLALAGVGLIVLAVVVPEQPL